MERIPPSTYKMEATMAMYTDIQTKQKAEEKKHASIVPSLFIICLETVTLTPCF